MRFGDGEELRCDVIAGCDGFHGICRDAVPDDVLSIYERVYPFAWLGILARAAPSSEELIYTHSDRGFALHSMRTHEVTRNYLQVRPDEDVEEWPDERIWEELQARMALADGGFSLSEGEIFEKGVTPMRSFVAEPMRFGQLFLAGDAAHIVPPTGAKGMNLAIADVRVLAAALARWYADGDARRARRLLRALPAAGLARAALLLVDDVDAAPLGRGRRVRGQAPALAARLRHPLGGDGPDAGRELRGARSRGCLTGSSTACSPAAPRRFGDRAWLQAMLDAEAALARARAAAGQIPPEVADAIAAACRAEDFDPAELGRAAVTGGNPAAPLAKALTARVAGDAAAGEVHRGFTSQDVVDTARDARRRAGAARAARRPGGGGGRVRGARGRATATRRSPAGRCCSRPCRRPSGSRRRAGAPGSTTRSRRLAAVPAGGAARRRGGDARVARRRGARGVAPRSPPSSGSTSPPLPWHTERGRIVALAAALGVACAAVAKVAGDVVLLSQTEVGEVREGTGGTSSTMPHKHNPVAAISALGCARQAPGLVASLLAAAGGHEHERAAGVWHAEWAPLRALLVATASRRRLAARLARRSRGRRRARCATTSTRLSLAERAATALAETMGRERANELVAEARARGVPGALPRRGRSRRVLDPAGATRAARARSWTALAWPRAERGQPSYTRTSDSATHTGFSPPSRSNVSAIVICAPPGTSSSPATFARMRTFPPTGMGAGKRTLLSP